MPSLRGHFLVASPHLVDPNFFRAVVLMVQHDEEGAFGLVLNRPTGKTIRDVWKLVSDEPCECESPIFLGGPVRGPLAAVHAYPDQSNLEVLPAVYYTVDDKSLSELLPKSEKSYRIFIGYSGWSAGQLETELEAGGWLTTPASADDVFDDPERLWQKVSRRIGREFLDATIRPRFVPDDPSMN
jgi:putative transcriptional regulator